MLPGRTDYIISRSQMTTLPLNISQMSSDTENSGGFGTFAASKEISMQTRLRRTVEERKTTEELG